jgi:hypothetical protein
VIDHPPALGQQPVNLAIQKSLMQAPAHCEHGHLSRENWKSVTVDGGVKTGRIQQPRRMSLSMPKDVFPLCTQSQLNVHHDAQSVGTRTDHPCGGQLTNGILLNDGVKTVPLINE